MITKGFVSFVAAAAAMAGVHSAHAAVTTTTSEAAFQGATWSDFTVVDLETIVLPASANDLGGFGLTSIGFDGPIVAGQAGQMAKPGRDRLLLNGIGFGGHVAFNLDSPVNGVGFISNFIDYGTLTAYAGANLTGPVIGSVTGVGGGFGGLISTVDTIGSFQISCDFDNDLRCGVYDIQFGVLAEEESGVPTPGALALLGLGLMGLGLRRRPA